MSTLSWIIAVSLAGGALSVLAAAAVSLALGAHRISMLISYAIGALLGAAFLEILPHALEHGDVHRTTGTVLFGIMAFFVLEKLVLWRHCHHDHCEAHDAHAPAHDHGRSGLLILVGDTFHNFVDGILIAAAFLQSTELGIVTAMAIIAHEIPQEVGDYLILLHSGYSKVRALAFNLLSSLATMVGAMLAYFALAELTEWIPSLLALGAASMIYVAVADLIPGLHKRSALKESILQVLLIGSGIASIAIVQALVGE
ncbi:MAG: ZIP zinc transporter [Betaproteobacteria bacterium HGW-Betaproteobacteria-6]|nr:MAG: ZIP zinc transporter [Betaproteobacteria bacterium HGW-Betaproteobacteria-6]